MPKRQILDTLQPRGKQYNREPCASAENMRNPSIHVTLDVHTATKKYWDTKFYAQTSEATPQYHKKGKGKTAQQQYKKKRPLSLMEKNIIFFPCCGALWCVLLCCSLLVPPTAFSVLCVEVCASCFFVSLFLQIADVEVFFCVLLVIGAYFCDK